MIRSSLPLLVSAALALGACTDGREPDFCRNHHLFHADHADEVGVLTIELAADGTLRKELQLPDALRTSYRDDELFNLNIEDDGRVRQIDVLAFDEFPELEELEVTMTTPATSKHFAISRQCENPIFRFE